MSEGLENRGLSHEKRHIEGEKDMGSEKGIYRTGKCIHWTKRALGVE